MNNYTLILTREEFDEVERVMRGQYRDMGIEAICATERRDQAQKAELKRRLKIQGHIVGKLMDLRRKGKEPAPAKDLTRERYI